MTKEELIRAESARRGLTIERTGKAWRIFGFNVDIVVASLASVDLIDLDPRVGIRHRTNV